MSVMTGEASSTGKRCPKCGEWKGKEEFNKNKTTKDGLQITCKQCFKSYYSRKPQYPRQTNGTKKCNKCLIEKHVSNFHTNNINNDGLSLYCNICRSRQRRKRTHNLSLEQVNEIYTTKLICCGICGKRLCIHDTHTHIDHNHKTFVVRGFLCQKCNLAIGLANDNTESLRKSAEYLLYWQHQPKNNRYYNIRCTKKMSKTAEKIGTGYKWNNREVISDIYTSRRNNINYSVVLAKCCCGSVNEVLVTQIKQGKSGSCRNCRNRIGSRANNGRKRCCWCLENKPVKNFRTRKSSSDGFETYCRPCGRLVRHKLSKKQIDSMLERQNHKCAICGIHKDDAVSGVGGLLIDHNHHTGQLRGLLCHNCNIMLGQARDQPQILYNAIDYLERHANPTTTTAPEVRERGTPSAGHQPGRHQEDDPGGMFGRHSDSQYLCGISAACMPEDPGPRQLPFPTSEAGHRRKAAA